MKVGDSVIYEEAKKEAMSKHRSDMNVIERKMFFGVERIFTIIVVPDPKCDICRGKGDNCGYLCPCVTTGQIKEEK